LRRQGGAEKALGELLHGITDPDNLLDAGRQVRRKKSAAGMDNVSVGKFEMGVETRLEHLRRQLWAGDYRPLPLRGSYVPKLSGGWRVAGVPAVRDRVA
jgi:retron-type reverse transcriptase